MPYLGIPLPKYGAGRKASGLVFGVLCGTFCWFLKSSRFRSIDFLQIYLRAVCYFVLLLFPYSRCCRAIVSAAAAAHCQGVLAYPLWTSNEE